jgi:hypothetical protein
MPVVCKSMLQRVNDTAVPKVTLSVVYRVRICVQADGGYFECLVN